MEPAETSWPRNLPLPPFMPAIEHVTQNWTVEYPRPPLKREI